MGSKELLIESSLKYLAVAIQRRADGQIYVPLFERLEKELMEIRSLNDVNSRIQKVANSA